MTPPHGRTVKDGQTRVPSSEDVGWTSGSYTVTVTVGRDHDRPVVRAYREGGERINRDEWRNLAYALAVEAHDYADAEDPETAGEDATLGPRSVAGA